MSSLFRASIAKGVTASVDREKRIITGYAVITRGEALGHCLWIDRDMLAAVVKAGNAAEGIKCRFTHPGLCSDGLGKFLGRARNFSLDGDVVRADLHLSEVADSSPDGRLGSYVMDLAEKDPKAFGTSIVFERDENAEDKFLMEHGATADSIAYSWGGPVDGFKSPDPDNAKNYRHARLSALQASDVVDEPAANAGGFFSRADETPARAEAALSYLFGLVDQAPELAMGGIEPQRARVFVSGFLQRHGLRIERTNRMSKPNEKLEDDPTKEPSKCEGDPPAVDPKADDEEDDEDGKGEEMGRLSERARFAALKKAFPGRAEFAMAQFEKGHSVEQAQSEFTQLRMKELENEVKQLRAGAPALRAGDGGEDSEDGATDFMGMVREHQKREKCSVREAMSAVVSANPEAYEEFRAAQSERPKRFRKFSNKIARSGRSNIGGTVARA